MPNILSSYRNGDIVLVAYLLTNVYVDTHFGL